MFDRILNKEIIDFNYPIDWNTFTLQLIEQEYNLKTAFCKTVLALYSYKQPKNFKDNRGIDLVLNFSSYSRHHLHHFFPRGYLDKINSSTKDHRESIVNIAFAPALWNNEISAEAPSDYINGFSLENKDIDETLASHLIGDKKEFGIVDNNFDTFLKKRASKIENEFRSLLGLKSKTEKQFEEKPSVPIDRFELRMRAILNYYLTKEFGENYWEEAVPVDIREVVDRKIQKDVRIHPYNESKYLNCIERLNFVDIMDYHKILVTNWILFRDVFVSKEEVSRHFSALNNYRNAIKHAHILDPVDQKNGEAAILWFERIFDEDEIKRDSD